MRNPTAPRYRRIETCRCSRLKAQSMLSRKSSSKMDLNGPLRTSDIHHSLFLQNVSMLPFPHTIMHTIHHSCHCLRSRLCHYREMCMRLKTSTRSPTHAPENLVSRQPQLLPLHEHGYGDAAQLWRMRSTLAISATSYFRGAITLRHIWIHTTLFARRSTPAQIKDVT